MVIKRSTEYGPLMKVRFNSRTGRMRTVRERSAAAPDDEEKNEEPAWGLSEASRDPNGTPPISYCTSRYTSTTVTASQISMQAITNINSVIIEEYTGSINTDEGFGFWTFFGEFAIRSLRLGGLWWGWSSLDNVMWLVRTENVCNGIYW